MRVAAVPALRRTPGPQTAKQGSAPPPWEWVRQCSPLLRDDLAHVAAGVAHVGASSRVEASGQVTISDGAVGDNGPASGDHGLDPRPLIAHDLARGRGGQRCAPPACAALAADQLFYADSARTKLTRQSSRMFWNSPRARMPHLSDRPMPGGARWSLVAGLSGILMPTQLPSTRPCSPLAPRGALVYFSVLWNQKV